MVEIIKRVLPDGGVGDAGGVRKCSGCSRHLGREAFDKALAMPDGLCVWCRECVAGLASGTAARLRAYQQNYNREYQRARRERMGLKVQKVRVKADSGKGTLLLRWSCVRGELRISGRWGLLEDAMRCMTITFGVLANDVMERGRGGGTGTARQKTFFSTGPVGREMWERGIAALKAEGMLV